MILLSIIITLLAASPKLKECGVVIKEYKTQTLFGKNVGFYVLFNNVSDKTVDAIHYKVNYLNGFDELIESRTYIWQAGNIDKPINPNDEQLDIKRAWIKGANKIKINIIRIHYENGTSCWN